MDGIGAAAPNPIDQSEVERLRALGYVIVPLKPTEQMVKVGAPLCFQAAAVRENSWDIALSDAADCYRAMIEVGCL
jgi:hypothetical protein